MVKKLVPLPLIFLILLGLLGVYQLHMQHNVEIYLSIPWRLLVSTYLFLVLSGLCIIVFLAEYFKKARSIADEALLLSLITVVVGLLVIAIDLERPERSGYAVLGHVNYGSVMFWMIMFYVIEVILLLFESWFHFRNKLLEKKDLISRIIVISRRIFTDEKKNHETAKALNFFAMITAILAYSNLGALFAVNPIEAWHGPFLPLFFISTAFVTAFSLAILIAVVHRKFDDLETLKYGLIFSLAAYTVFLVWRVIIGIYPAYFSEEILVYFKTPSFWLMEILVGILIPVIIITVSKNRLALFSAAIAVLLGMLFQRINFVYTGQEYMLISGMKLSSQIFTFEILILIGALALVSLLYYILREVVK